MSEQDALSTNNALIYPGWPGRDYWWMADVAMVAGWKGLIWGLAGGAILVSYGVIPTLQLEPAFGRVYAAYGGIFIVLSILWARVVDGWHPDRFDILGAGIALLGVFIIIWGRNWF